MPRTSLKINSTRQLKSNPIGLGVLEIITIIIKLQFYIYIRCDTIYIDRY